MKLLIISQYFYPEQFRITDVCIRLAALGHEITVLTGLPNYPGGEIYNGYEWKKIHRAQGISQDNDSGHFNSRLKVFQEEIKGVKVLRCKLYPRGKGKLDLIRNYISFAFHATRASAKIVSEGYKFDKILIFQYSPVTMAIPGILLKKKLRTDLVLYCFDLWPESIVSAGLSNHGAIYNMVLLLSKWIYKKADIILISSRNFVKYFNEKLGIYYNIHYLPIYAEDLFVREVTVESTPCSTVNLVFAGNVGEMQCLETIIKAADLLKENKEAHFHIVGNGSTLEKNIRLAKDMALENITFHGHHPLEEMPNFYAMADAFLVTLKKDSFISYTLPGKVQSYMTSGKPIIAAIDGETADVIRNANCGLCCEAENHIELANIIQRFIDEKENRQKYGDNSKKYYDANFSIDSFMKSLLTYLT